MKKIFLTITLVASFSVLSASDSTCESNEDCTALIGEASNFNNPEVTREQADNAFVMADEILSDIGRSIAGDFEDVE